MIHAIYFSPAHSTRKIVKAVAEGIGKDVTNHDITQGVSTPISFAADDWAVIGVPVYYGRVPTLATQYLMELRAEGIPAVLVCVYGNREYEDALLELKNLTEACGFKAVSGAAFIARHAIFPNVAHDRPTADDLTKAHAFGQMSGDSYTPDSDVVLNLKGNFPYRSFKLAPLTPKGRRGCDACGVCSTVCPTGAISKERPKQTDKTKCIACARCIEMCPKKVRRFGGLLYSIVRWRFSKDNKQPKEIELFFAQ